MSTPEIVLGASLLTLFVASVQLPFIPAGRVLSAGHLTTILIAHIMFNISFVVVTVKARLQGFPRHLEEAAMDLGANEWTTFWKVTFPLILPGVVAAALLAFSLSIDDYVITNFTAGTTETFPLYIYGSQHRGIPVQVNVIGTMIFVVAVGLVAADARSGQRRAASARDHAAATSRLTSSRAIPRHRMVDDRAAEPGRRPWTTPLPDHAVVPAVWAGSRTSTSTAARGRG